MMELLVQILSGILEGLVAIMVFLLILYFILHSKKFRNMMIIMDVSKIQEKENKEKDK